MSRVPPHLAAARRTVQCTNEECPEVATKGKPWTGQRKAVDPDGAPCPKCSSAVVAVADAPESSTLAGLRADARRLEEAEPLSDAEVEAYVVDTAVRLLAAPKPSFMGIPRLTLGGVRIGMAARQRLAQLQKQPAHRGKSLDEIAGVVLDQWGAGLLDPQGVA